MMREDVEIDMRADSPMIMSPTALTNAVRRAKATAGQAQGSAFLAAENFQEIGAPMERTRSDGTAGQKYNIPFVETVQEGKTNMGSFEGCRAPLMRRPKNCREVKDVAFEVKEVAMSTPVKTAVKEQYVKPARVKAKVLMVQARETVGKASVKAKEMQPDEEQVRGCMRETRETGDMVAKYANLVYDMFAQECVPVAARGDQRGDDSMFFRYGSTSTQGSPGANKQSNRMRAFSPMSSESIPDDAFRSPKCMRYPEAAKIVNPIERSERKKNRDRVSPDLRDSSEETREDTADSPENSFNLDVMKKGDDQASLREVRLQMYKFDDGEKNVPRARLSRALGELAAQDTTIDTLQEKLKDTKLLLQEKEDRLAEAEMLCRKHERRIQELMEKASEDKRALETRIAREAQAKGKLQSRIDVLQREIYRLRAQLGESTGGSTLSPVARGELRRVDTEESGTDGEVWEGILSEAEDDNATVEVSLRAEIVSLKSQLADTHAAESISSKSRSSSHNSKSRSSSHNSKSQLSSHNSKASNASRGLYMSSESSDEASQLRQKLESAEAELAALRASKNKLGGLDEKLVALQQTLNAAEKELLESTQQLEEAKTRETDLLKELEDAKKRIAELESEHATNHMNTLEEAEDLKLLYKENSKESEAAKNRALSELEESRAEVEELKAEVKCLTEKISELSQNSVALTEERLKERERLEEALHRCKDTEHQLRDQIMDLEERLEKAQASTLQLANVSNNMDDGRSVKRKLDDSMGSESGALVVTRESFQVEERAELREQLRRSQAAEERLRSEMAITRELLRCAEKVVVEMESEMKEETRLRSNNEALLMKELNDLRKKLEDSEQKNREAIAARDKDAKDHSKKDEALRQSEKKQQALLNQIHILKAALESVEIERQHEKMEMVEEERIHEDLESKRIKEIDSLRVELANVRAKAEKSNELQAEVDELKSRLAEVKVQSDDNQKTSTRESRKRDEISNKLKTEMSAVKQRLAAIRKRNAARRQRSVRISEVQKDDASTTDDLSSSGESAQSLGFSAPDFSSPERRSTGTSVTSSPSTISARSSLHATPWTSPQRPLGSFPSPPRQRVDVSSLSSSPRQRVDGAGFPSPPRQRVDVSSLRQRLLESNQRLQDANTRLSGLEKSSGNMAQEHQSRTENLSDEIMTLAEQASDSTPRSPDRSFQQRLQVRVTENKPAQETENKPAQETENKQPSVSWPGFDEGSI